MLVGQSVIEEHESAFRIQHRILHHILLQAQHVHKLTFSSALVKGSNKRAPHLRTLLPVLQTESQIEHIECAVIADESGKSRSL